MSDCGFIYSSESIECRDKNSLHFSLNNIREPERFGKFGLTNKQVEDALNKPFEVFKEDIDE